MIDEHKISTPQLHKIFYDTETYNNIVRIDKTKYYEESIVKACNDILKQLINNKTIIKPNFKHTKYPNDTYKEYQKSNNPCKNTI